MSQVLGALLLHLGLEPLVELDGTEVELGLRGILLPHVGVLFGEEVEAQDLKKLFKRKLKERNLKKLNEIHLFSKCLYV